jgi:putative peptidoglycan lipid II flippase
LRLILTLMVPASAVLFGLSRPVVVALLQRGAFGTRGATLVAETLVGFAAGLPAFSVYLYALRLFYAMHNTRTPFLLNSLENGLNIALALVLYPLLGISGLAVAYSGAYVVAAVVTLAVASRRLGGLQGRQVGSTAARVVLAGAAVAAATWAVADVLGWASARRALLTTAAGLLVAVAVGVAGLLAMRVPELRELVAAFQRRGAPEHAVTR